MGLFGIGPAVMRPTALVMNIAVASISLYKFSERADFAGDCSGLRCHRCSDGVHRRPDTTSDPMVRSLGRVRAVFSAIRLFIETLVFERGPHDQGHACCCCTGARRSDWLLSGLTGVGGGIFLSPLLVLTVGDGTRQCAATAAFVLVNSVSGLLGLLSRQPTIPEALRIGWPPSLSAASSVRAMDRAAWAITRCDKPLARYWSLRARR